MGEKPVVWVGRALDDLRAFPDGARRRAGYELHQVQQGLRPSDWKPLVNVGQGVEEIRIHGPAEHRVVYVARFPEAVYVLHAFKKKTRRTSRQDLALIRDRLATVSTARRPGGKES